MQLHLRRIGNSLGIIIPRTVLGRWGVAEGDALELDGDAIRPPSGSKHEALDEHRRLLSVEVIAAHTPEEIRRHSLENLARWQQAGVWVSAYDEWREIMTSGDEGALFAAMLGRDDRAVRLRQSLPYVGMLPRETVARRREEAAR